VTQTEAVASWWQDADTPTRRRALRLAPDDLLPEDLQRGLSMSGVTVVPAGTAADGSVAGYVPPDVLVAFLDEQRGT